MTDFASLMEKYDRKIFDSVGDAISHGSVEVQGVFYRIERQVQIEQGLVTTLELSFDCRYSDVSNLVEGDTVTLVRTAETFTFRRFIPDKGDETGRVTLELAL